MKAVDWLLDQEHRLGRVWRPLPAEKNLSSVDSIEIVRALGGRSQDRHKAGLRGTCDKSKLSDTCEGGYNGDVGKAIGSLGQEK